jgi:acyl-CoA reductase-like NAD-dependent aldehyde dehydrogenase
MTGLDHAPATPDGAYVRPINPSTLAPLDRVRTTSPAQLDAAAGRAAAALAGSWPVDSRWRAGVLADWGAALAIHAAELADALVAETGKPIVEARQEVRAAVDSLAYNSGLARNLAGSAGTLPDGTVAHLVREPVGVTTFITPWNWPVLLLLRDLAPALAAGVTALVKPAPQTTLVTDRVLSVGRAAGLPADVVQLLVGTAEVGRAAVTHPAVRAVAFTGSSTVGTEVLRMASSGMKRCLLELGGKGAMVICADADVPGAVSAAADAAVITAGQMCLACTRVIVDRLRYAEVVERLVERLRTFHVGDPVEERTKIGPLVSPAAGERLAARLAAAGDAAAVLGGERVHPDGLPGAFIRPAVVTGVAADSPIVQTELFGPVVTVEPFRDDAEAVRLANATRFGLAIGVWTRDLDRAWRLARSVQAGTVWVNGYYHSYPDVPSGGVKSSGLGRSRGVPGIEQFTELKHIHFRVPAPVTEPATEW